MELSDVILTGTSWNKAVEKLLFMFDSKSPARYKLYMLALSIGIMYDQRIEKPEGNEEEAKSTIGRNVFFTHDNGKLDLMFQAAILSSATVQYTEEERLAYAFGEKSDLKKLDFLTQFANFGITKLVEQIGDSPLESMENLKNFLFSTVEGRNLEIESLSDDILLEDDF